MDGHPPGRTLRPVDGVDSALPSGHDELRQRLEIERDALTAVAKLGGLSHHAPQDWTAVRGRNWATLIVTDTVAAAMSSLL